MLKALFLFITTPHLLVLTFDTVCCYYVLYVRICAMNTSRNLGPGKMFLYRQTYMPPWINHEMNHEAHPLGLFPLSARELRILALISP
jgi:hypothetical protein